MKLRSGFVSNSSSSSFIFGLSKNPKNANDLIGLLYPSGRDIVCTQFLDTGESTQNAAHYIFPRMNKLTKKNLTDHMSRRYAIYDVEQFVAKTIYGGWCGRKSRLEAMNDDTIDKFLDSVALHNKDPKHDYYMFATDRALSKAFFQKSVEREKQSDVFYEAYHEARNKFEKDWFKKHPVELPDGVSTDCSKIQEALKGEYYKTVGSKCDKAFHKSVACLEAEKLRPSKALEESMLKLERACGKADAEAFLEANKKAKLFEVEISDHDSAVLEHGDTFSEVLCMRISNH